MNRQHILLVGDAVGYGKIANPALAAVLSRIGHATYELPTALVSNNFAYGKFSMLDTTEYLSESINVWHELGFTFDAVATGFLASPRQAHIVADYCRELSAKGAKVFVDPIMGDDGRLYNGVGEEAIKSMKEVLSQALLCYPNYTEACLLTGNSYSTDGTDMKSARQMIDQLREIGSQSVLITSIRVDGTPSVVGYNHVDNDYFCLTYNEIPVQFPGTGDIFAAMLVGRLLAGDELKTSTRKAMDLVYKLVDANKNCADPRRGMVIEPYLENI